MTGYRWSSSRNSRRLRRRWRRAYMERAAGRRSGRLRTGLALLLGAELVVGAGQGLFGTADRLRLIRLEEEYRLEWRQPGVSGTLGAESGAAAGTCGAEAGGASASKPDTGTVYGIRLDPKRLEIQFYQQKPLDSIN